jgi:GH15 family glucan-1,4-alpha-glucosidase
VNARQAPISDYAVIGDCHTVALISKHGSLDWLCLPDFGGPAWFARLLDAERGGEFSICCKDAQVTRRYVGDTAIVETTFVTGKGMMRLTDSMSVQPNARRNHELHPMREVLRRVDVIEGAPDINVRVAPRPDFGRKLATWERRGKNGWAISGRNALLHLLTDFPLQESPAELSGSIKGKPGQTFWFSLTFETAGPAIYAPLGGDAEARLEMTRLWWEYWISDCKYHGPHADMVRRSAITLRLLTYPLSGALVAAATTSLPEKPGGDYNWDYRFCWPRDAALAICAFLDIGLTRESAAFFGWLGLAAGIHSPALHPVYDIFGRQAPRDEELKHLSGYQGSGPVRIGNGAGHELQHDVYGEVMLAVSEMIERGTRHLPIDAKLLAGFGDTICNRWREPDNGIWELPEERRHYTYSKVMAWYVLDRLICLHRREITDIQLDRYLREREELRRAIEQRGFNARRNSYMSVFEGDEVDASLLMLPRTGFVAYDHPRMKGTWKALQSDLGRDALIYRFPKDTKFGLRGEGSFIICGFWAVEYLAASGEVREARRRFEELLGYANDLGLYAEGFDPDIKDMCGNFPQAFSHTGLINAVAALEKAERKEAA